MSTKQSSGGLVLVGGAGPGLGMAIANKFSSTGFKVVGLNRSAHDSCVDDVELVSLDTSDSQATLIALDDIIDRYGCPAVYIHNPAHLIIKPFASVTADEFIDSWQSMVLSAFNCLQAVLPHMANARAGTVIVSGATASSRGGAKFAAFSSAKFALRGLTQSLAREYQPLGVHVAHVILDGVIDTARSRSMHSMDPDKMMLADDIATQYLQLCHQPPSTWTHELDLRPQSESF